MMFSNNDLGQDFWEQPAVRKQDGRNARENLVRT